jgi:hypothetical protein
MKKTKIKTKKRTLFDFHGSAAKPNLACAIEGVSVARCRICFGEPSDLADKEKTGNNLFIF